MWRAPDAPHVRQRGSGQAPSRRCFASLPLADRRCRSASGAAGAAGVRCARLGCNPRRSRKPRSLPPEAGIWMFALFARCPHEPGDAAGLPGAAGAPRAGVADQPRGTGGLLASPGRLCPPVPDPQGSNRAHRGGGGQADLARRTSRRGTSAGRSRTYRHLPDPRAHASWHAAPAARSEFTRRHASGFAAGGFCVGGADPLTHSPPHSTLLTPSQRKLGSRPAPCLAENDPSFRWDDGRMAGVPRKTRPAQFPDPSSPLVIPARRDPFANRRPWIPAAQDDKVGAERAGPPRVSASPPPRENQRRAQRR